VQQRDDTQFESAGVAELSQDREWWEIYEHSFPPEEREPPRVILDSAASGAGLAFRARRGGATVAIATTHELRNPPAVFLVYLAVESGRRDAGIGGRLFEYAWSASAEKLRERGIHPLGLVWEVDPPDSGAFPASDGLTQQRISFFERHGGILLCQPYLQPPVNGPESVQMRLMFRPAGGTIPDAATIEGLVRGIYFEKYAGVNRIAVETLESLLRQCAADSQ
jgi:GNAT superfamily N-acetyltransferase